MFVPPIRGGQPEPGMVRRPTRLVDIVPPEFSQHIGQEANQDVSLRAFCYRSPYRADRAIGFLNVKGVLAFGQLDAGPLQFLRAPVEDFAAQQIAAMAQPRPIAPPVELAPTQASRAIGVSFHFDLKQSGSPYVVQQSPHALGNGQRIHLAQSPNGSVAPHKSPICVQLAVLFPVASPDVNALTLHIQNSLARVLVLTTSAFPPQIRPLLPFSLCRTVKRKGSPTHRGDPRLFPTNQKRYTANQDCGTWASLRHNLNSH